MSRGYFQKFQIKDVVFLAIMSAVALLQMVPKPTDDEIYGAMTGNLCRCATYHRIRAAIHNAASSMEG